MTQGTTDQDQARKGRLMALVISGTIVIWLVLNVIGKMVGLDERYAFLFDFAAMAALIWVLVNLYQIWRARQANKG